VAVDIWLTGTEKVEVWPVQDKVTEASRH
jgi:hypothetical protein